jgi:D-alanyl-lipoteichoic acid acyltransferase DltB (MBOAT superfamily)
MLPQFHRSHRLRYDNVIDGGWLIGYGLFKKMCVADTISPFVAGVYADPAAYTGGYHALAALLFAVQIYCDFSGYSDIARGVARILGWELMINFRQPYFAASLTEFWRRWHISLSSWFRDYLYVPLGGARQDAWRGARNIVIVFLASGIWHGAAWTFVIWGALHAMGLLAERWFRDTRARQRLGNTLPRATRVLGHAWTLLLVLAGWIFFRASSLSGAADVFRSFRNLGTFRYGTFNTLGLSAFQSLSLLMSLALLCVVDGLLAYRPQLLQNLRTGWGTVTGVALLYYVLLFGVFGRTEFIYFQF